MITSWIVSGMKRLAHLPDYHSPVNVYCVHWKKDHVIPCPTAGCDVIDGAGHLLAITHPKETAAFLEKVGIQLTMR